MPNYSSTTVLLMAIPELKSIAPQHYEDILILAKQDRSAIPWSRFSALAIGGVAVYLWFQFGAGRQLQDESIWFAIFINMGLFLIVGNIVEFCLLSMLRDKVVAQLARTDEWKLIGANGDASDTSKNA
ncbi:hypothetical protein [Undibacterium sp. Ren11W]|uniref:hypothetical protein n=1 Tax=Undibacterium sp. Ren11W TaxID=3413045 RepID=UPI003BF422C0